jgi:hypothetical protein
MRKIGKDASLIIFIFIVSRIIIYFFGVHFRYDALLKYWQYLDVETLKHNLLKGVWYDHAQPPVFNLFLGTVLKIFGDHAEFVFALIFKLITLVNTLLILAILKSLTTHRNLPLIISLIYLLSPASMILENELFYTTFISMLLLLGSFFLLRLQERITWKAATGFLLPLVIVCLSRSMYHLLWLFVISLAIIFYYRRRNGIGKFAVVTVCALLVVGSVYVKNYFIFGKFSTSSWIGMNLSRNVFHYETISDSSKIEAIEPFSQVSVYRPFLQVDYEKKYGGLNDLDLLREYKNNTDSLLNMNNAAYIEISDKYLDASKKEIRAKPMAYLKNVVQSSIIFFAPATRYPLAEQEVKKIKYYDVVYSFNLSHFAEGKQQRRIALLLSAVPKMLVYLLVFFFILRQAFRTRRMSLFNVFLLTTIAYVFALSSLVEHYENMRFRYEIEPLFLLLLGQVLALWLTRKKVLASKPRQARL